MGPVAALSRRRWLASAGAFGAGALAGCAREELAFPPGGWVGDGVERGHRLRAVPVGTAPDAGALQAAAPRRAHTVVVGGGIAGLAAARTLVQRGVDDVALLELHDDAGGNSRGHRLGGMACPLGAHYLPLPGPQAREVQQLLFDLGLARHRLGRTEVDERHLCHSPQERLLFEGQWHDGLFPPLARGSAAEQQAQRFAAAVARAQRELGFALPSHRAPFGPGHRALDGQTFATWLDAQGLADPTLRWYLDYCCRDDYGAPAAEVSAWAGLHYFASRHGFAAGLGEAGEAAREPVLTWPEGNAWLARALAQPLGARLHTARTVLRVQEERGGVQLWVQDEAAGRLEHWQAQRVILATPLFVALRLLATPPPALAQAVAALRWAPWMVANLHLREPLLDREGAPPSWDNVRFGSAALGYVDAMHQSTRAHAGPTVLTLYWALPQAERAALYSQPWAHWGRLALDELARMHPDAPAKVAGMALARHGHAMAVPVPGARGHPALAALRAERGAWGRLRFAHADLAATSVFEEAYTAGCEAAA